MAITSVKIRATIQVGNNITVNTPYVLSFNVTKTRNSKSTFSASLKIPATNLGDIDSNKITISAGTSDKKVLIFTGYILTNRATPAWDDPKYVVLNVTGSDILYKLESERYTRRQMDALSKFAIIENVVRKAQTGAKFKVRKEPLLVTSLEHRMDEQKEDKQNISSDLSRLGVTPKNMIDETVDVEIGQLVFDK